MSELIEKLMAADHIWQSDKAYIEATEAFKIIRQHQAEHEQVGQREIRVVDQDELYSTYYHLKHRDKIGEKNAFLKVIRLFLATREPVSVSLRDIAAIIEDGMCRAGAIYDYHETEVAKAVLDAAGVPYVD